MRIARMLKAVTLQGAEVIGVTEFGAQLLEDGPIALRVFGADFIRGRQEQARADAARERASRRSKAAPL